MLDQRNGLGGFRRGLGETNLIDFIHADRCRITGAVSSTRKQDQMSEDSTLRTILDQYNTYAEAKEQLTEEFGELAPWVWDSAVACLRLKIISRNNRLNRRQSHFLGLVTEEIEMLFSRLDAERTEKLLYKSLWDEDRAGRLAAEKRYDGLVASIRGLIEIPAEEVEEVA